MADINSRIAAAQNELSALQTELASLQTSSATTAALASVAKHTSLPSVRNPPSTKLRRTLKGHFGKVVDLSWAQDSQSVVSASQDGKLLLWNAVTTSKRDSITLKSNYVMCVSTSPQNNSNGNLVASGGLDNLCTLHKWGTSTPLLEMASHDGYISCVRFLPHNTNRLLSSSGDSTIIQWDLSSGRVIDVLEEHKHDVMRISLNPTNSNLFVSASVDRTAKLWDLRTPRTSVQTFVGHLGDIDGIDYMPNDAGVCFATASEDGQARLYDTRSSRCIGVYGSLLSSSSANNNNNSSDVDATNHGLTSCAFSASGRVLFAGHADGNVLMWDVLKPGQQAAAILPHESHVSCVSVNPKGDALCTGSWDTTLKIWA